MIRTNDQNLGGPPKSFRIPVIIECLQAVFFKKPKEEEAANDKKNDDDPVIEAEHLGKGQFTEVTPGEDCGFEGGKNLGE